MKKRIALITTDVDRQYQINLIKIMSEQAAALGYDLIILTHFVNYANSSDYIAGEENIYSLIAKMRIDGAVMAFSSFYNTALAEQIEQMLHEKSIPVVALDYKSRLFPSCLQNDRKNFCTLTEHFIAVHGFTDIFCLAGPKDDIHSEQRIQGYSDAMQRHGIPVQPENIFYGDFWLAYAKDLAENIVAGNIRKPQAIVCGNDYMALQLSLTLLNHGIRVPEDIAIGGYDGNPDTDTFQPMLTTFSSTYLENGVDAVLMLDNLISPSADVPKIQTHPAIRIGSTCGCQTGVTDNAPQNQKRLDESLSNALYLHSSYSSVMNHVRSVKECSHAIMKNLYLLNADSNIYFCLCTDWEGDYERPENYRKHGYTDTMRCILSRIQGRNDDSDILFPLEDIIPASEAAPMTYICTPLHYQDRSLGYCVRSCRYDKIVFENYYGEFCQVTANAIEKIRTLAYEEYLQQKIQRLSERDIITGLYSRKGLEAQISSLDRTQTYYAVLYYIEGSERYREHFGEEYFRQLMISFSQAVNLSCMRSELSAHIGKNSFVIIGACDGTDFPEQLFINTLRSNLKLLEMHRNLSIPLTFPHFSAVTDHSTAPEDLLSILEKKLADYKNARNKSSDVYWTMLHELQYRIYEEPQLAWNAAEAAQQLGISTSYFQHIYKKNFEISFNADVIHARISLAERLLKQTHLSVSEVAEKCGYTDVSYFMKLFKKKNGKTAMAYKKSQN